MVGLHWMNCTGWKRASVARCLGCGNRLGYAASKPEKGRAMGIPQNKVELLLAIDTNFGKLFKALQAVPESRMREPTLAGYSKGTTMSVANLLAYLIG
jgi:hypothetical protein